MKVFESLELEVKFLEEPLSILKTIRGFHGESLYSNIFLNQRGHLRGCS